MRLSEGRNILKLQLQVYFLILKDEQNFIQNLSDFRIVDFHWGLNYDQV